MTTTQAETKQTALTHRNRTVNMSCKERAKVERRSTAERGRVKGKTENKVIQLQAYKLGNLLNY